MSTIKIPSKEYSVEVKFLIRIPRDAKRETPIDIVSLMLDKLTKNQESLAAYGVGAMGHVGDVIMPSDFPEGAPEMYGINVPFEVDIKRSSIEGLVLREYPLRDLEVQEVLS